MNRLLKSKTDAGVCALGNGKIGNVFAVEIDLAAAVFLNKKEKDSIKL